MPIFGLNLISLTLICVLVLPGELGLLLLLVAVLAVVHHPRDGRIRLRSDLDQVEALGVGVLARFVGRLDPDLLAVLAHQAHLGDADVLVDPVLRLWDSPVFRTASGPQRLFTKLVESSSSTTKTAASSGHHSSSNRLG